MYMYIWAGTVIVKNLGCVIEEDIINWGNDVFTMNQAGFYILSFFLRSNWMQEGADRCLGSSQTDQYS